MRGPSNFLVHWMSSDSSSSSSSSSSPDSRDILLLRCGKSLESSSVEDLRSSCPRLRLNLSFMDGFRSVSTVTDKVLLYDSRGDERVRSSSRSLEKLNAQEMENSHTPERAWIGCRLHSRHGFSRTPDRDGNGTLLSKHDGVRRLGGMLLLTPAFTENGPSFLPIRNFLF